MMGGYGTFTMQPWMPLLALFCIVLIVVVVWLAIRWLNRSQVHSTPAGPPPQQQHLYEAPSYEQGYQPPPQPLQSSQPLQTEGTYQEGGTVHSYTPTPTAAEQSQTPYPQQERPSSR